MPRTLPLEIFYGIAGFRERGVAILDVPTLLEKAILLVHVVREHGQLFVLLSLKKQRGCLEGVHAFLEAVLNE